MQTFELLNKFDSITNITNLYEMPTNGLCVALIDWNWTLNSINYLRNEWNFSLVLFFLLSNDKNRGDSKIYFFFQWFSDFMGEFYYVHCPFFIWFQKLLTVNRKSISLTLKFPKQGKHFFSFSFAWPRNNIWRHSSAVVLRIYMEWFWRPN